MTTGKQYKSEGTDAMPVGIASTDQLGAVAGVCKWTQEDYDSDVWQTDCGDAMCLNEGTPGDNFMRFCCYCGKTLDSVPWVYEADA